MVFDLLIPKEIRLRKRYTGAGGNSTAAPVLKLFHICEQLRREALDCMHCRKPIFSISIHDARFFPLPLEVRRLKLRTIELDEKTIYRSDNAGHDCLPTPRTREAIRKFGRCWAGHRIEELVLQLLMAPNTEYNGVAYGTNLTVASVFAPLGYFTQVRVRCRPNKGFGGRVIMCQRAFEAVAKTLRCQLSIPVEQRLSNG